METKKIKHQIFGIPETMSAEKAQLLKFYIRGFWHGIGIGLSLVGIAIGIILTFS